MVAFALGEEYEARGNHKEAADWYSTAQVRFPLQEYRLKATVALQRVRARLERPEAGAPASVSRLELAGLAPTETLFIVACTKTKIWQVDREAPEYVPARYAYCGESFKAFLRWLEEVGAESQGFRWLILSARYGYVEPWHPIEDYDVTFDDPQTGPVPDEALYAQVMFQTRWRDRKPLRDFRMVIYSGSTTYGKKVRTSFRALPVEVRALQLQ